MAGILNDNFIDLGDDWDFNFVPVVRLIVHLQKETKKNKDYFFELINIPKTIFYKEFIDSIKWNGVLEDIVFLESLGLINFCSKEGVVKEKTGKCKRLFVGSGFEEKVVIKSLAIEAEDGGFQFIKLTKSGINFKRAILDIRRAERIERIRRRIEDRKKLGNLYKD